MRFPVYLVLIDLEWVLVGPEHLIYVSLTGFISTKVFCKPGCLAVQRGCGGKECRDRPRWGRMRQNEKILKLIWEC